ncbi:MAG TPA: tRNA uridine-5-carboxymethylaminomethyl(34) synthesis GTPase MnmE [Dissulfurispiraceae bacterium]|nr:tRNA uridine-5-carboxymethylaminomethyl(34) synthesis GTPase MnmE [Dissulfurispiraceae bacterium]
MLLDDTIAAISTPFGEGGLGVVRVSGDRAESLAEKIFRSPKGRTLAASRSHTIVYGHIVDPQTGERIDEVLIGVMRAPRTYTREDVIEISCHGGPVPLKSVLSLLLREGARLAEPGEFTKRAFLNGRIDLSQAEAVIDVIRAKTGRAERLAIQQLEGRLSERILRLREELLDLCALVEAYIDFPEDEIEPVEKAQMAAVVRDLERQLSSLSRGFEAGRLFREGVAAAIVGKPNVGKSSLLNALLDADRAIVTEIPGTTRDVIEECLNIQGVPLRIMDTAGIRETHDLAELEGVRRSLGALEHADVVIAVFDGSRRADKADEELVERVRAKKTLYVVNKCDIRNPSFSLPHGCNSCRTVSISALTGEGIEDLKDEVYSLLMPVGRNGREEGSSQTEGVLITNMRHKQAIDHALEAVSEVTRRLDQGDPLEVTALYLRESLNYLGEIVGAATTEDILDRIFSQFCIGK